jgi:hypothetical protein
VDVVYSKSKTMELKVKDHGVIMAEAARHLGVSTSALSKAMK